MIFGTNEVYSLEEKKIMFDGDYHYSFHKDIDSLNTVTKELNSMTLFCLEGVINFENGDVLNTFEYLNISNEQVKVLSGNFKCLLSGSKLNEEDSYRLKYSLNQTKKVSKPWGAEYWIKGRGGHYCFKYIQLNAGHKTSLQYHEEKKETNLLWSGECSLHFNKTNKEATFVSGEDIEITKVEEKNYIHVNPMTVHRLESITDIHLFETSTTQLDDVIRISDDTNRVDGLIKSEHE